LLLTIKYAVATIVVQSLTSVRFPDDKQRAFRWEGHERGSGSVYSMQHLIFHCVIYGYTVIRETKQNVK